jgi:hypothetical protein
MRADGNIAEPTGGCRFFESSSYRAAVLLAVTSLGAYLRFASLGDPPFWIDEAIFMDFVRHGGRQEFLPVWIAQLFGLEGEFWVRFPFALCGTLTIPAVYFVIRDKKGALVASLFTAVFPVFVLWSRMARPYAIAGLFVVLGYRYALFYVPALLATPITVFGLNMQELRSRWQIYLVIGIGAIILYLIRPDSTNRSFIRWEFLSNASRIWYVPALSLLLHAFECLPFHRVLGDSKLPERLLG